MTVTVVGDSKLRMPLAAVPPEVRRAFREDLTLPNPAFVAAVKQGRPTGRMSPTLTLYREYGDLAMLPRGYATKALEHLRRAGVKVRVVDRRLRLPEVDFAFHGELLPYQRRAVEALRGDGILVAPPGSGKSIVALAVMAAVGQPALWVTHTQDLARQAIERSSQFLGLDPDEVGFIGDGVWRVGERLTVALVQSLARRFDDTKALARRIGLVIVDEAHHTPATTFLHVVGLFPAWRRLGLTATPNRADGLWPFAEAAIGPVLHRLTPEELEAAGKLVRPKLVWVLTGFRHDFDGDWHALMDALTTDPERNRLVVDLVAKEAKAGHLCLVLSERVAHCELLAAVLRRMLRPDQVAVLTGSTPRQEREAAIAGARAGKVRVLLATRLADEGLDLPSLERLFVVTPRRAATKVLQQAGRVMRAAPGKAEPVIYDFRDRLTPVLEAQARARWFEVYRGLVASEEWAGAYAASPAGRGRWVVGHA